MAYDTYRGDTSDQKAYLAHLMGLFTEVRTRRSNFEAQWDEVAALCWPEFRGTFTYGYSRSPGQKLTQAQVDSTGPIAAHRFAAIADVLLTPFSLIWSKIEAGGPDARELMAMRPVKLYFSELTQRLWEYRYRPDANFIGSNQRNMQSLGVFGNMGMLIDELDTQPGEFDPGLRYISTHVGEMYPLENHQGRIDGFIRHFRWTPRQALQRWREKCPESIRRADERNSQERINFLHFVLPRTDYDPDRFLAPQGKPYTSCYVFADEPCVMEEGGYRSFPWAAGRYMQAPDEVEGRGPGEMVLPELKTLNAEKGLFLKQGHRAADPAYLLPSDDLIDFKNFPGAFNYGGMGPNGEKLVDILPTGDLQITEKMMEASTRVVNDAFLVTLYPLLFDDRGRVRTAREMIEAANDRSMFLSPLGRQLTEYIGPMVSRELDVLSWLGLLPEMPEVLREAGAPYRVKCTGPLAKALAGQPIAGFMRSVELAQATVAAGGSPDIMDVFDFDTAIPEIAEEQFTPARWMSSPKKIAERRKARQKQIERDREVKELPGRAAIMKANAISDKAKAGQNIGGTLSGTMEGGMPMLPGQGAPGGKPFP